VHALKRNRFAAAALAALCLALAACASVGDKGFMPESGGRTPFDWLARGHDIELVRESTLYSPDQVNRFWSVFLDQAEGLDASVNRRYLVSFPEGRRIMRVRVVSPGIVVLVDYLIETPTASAPDGAWPISTALVLRPVGMWSGNPDGVSRFQAWDAGQTSTSWLNGVTTRLEAGAQTARAAMGPPATDAALAGSTM
jgi:hypothetical protein